ncbi:MAG TPA: DUF4235 domain-containing protein [Nocardioidaceae bacterium]|jgi:hypothetical protein|nr:DUF4235 domain-containing protein [Nocardioidaceae bacterium]
MNAHPSEEVAVAGSRLWRVYGMAAAAGAMVVTRQLLDKGWRLATGKYPPKNPEHPDVTMPEAMAWAIASGVAVGVARMLAARQAAQYWRRSTGQLPPGMDELKI